MTAFRKVVNTIDDVFWNALVLLLFTVTCICFTWFIFTHVKNTFKMVYISHDRYTLSTTIKGFNIHHISVSTKYISGDISTH